MHSAQRKQITVDGTWLVDAMENHDSIAESSYYLDLETGETELIDHEILTIVESGDTTSLDRLPEWQKEQAFVAKAILVDDQNRYVPIPQLESRESFLFMKEFAEQLIPNQSKIADQLFNALNSNKPFRHFKDALENYPDVRDQWFAFKDQKL